jgi:sugar-specific transcriptional regulator TrmB
MPDQPQEPQDREALLDGLRRCGLNGYESAVYLGLVTDQDAKVAEISKRTGVPQPKVYQALESLVEKGFCAVGSDAVNRYRPIPPRVALEGHVAGLRAQQSAAADLGRVLEDLLQRGKGKELWAPPVEVVKGMRQIVKLLSERIDAAQSEVLCFCKGPHLAALEIAQALRRATARGVSLRLLSDESYYDSDEAHEEQIALYRNMPGEKRELEHVPSKMVLVDRQIALLSVLRPATVRAEDFMVLALRQEGLVQHFLASFEHAWERAKPIRFDQGS